MLQYIQRWSVNAVRVVNVNVKQKISIIPILIILGFFSIAYLIYYFREGFLIREGELLFDKNPIYLTVFGSFLFLSVWVSLHYIFLIGRVSKITKKISKAYSFDDVCAVFQKDRSVLTQIWEDYRRTFIVSESNSDDEDSSVFSSMTRVDADLYFNSDEIVNNAGLRLPFTVFIKLIPGAFIGLGILGTFIGFSQSINFDTNAVEVSQLKNLFAGLNVAFGTSIIGVLTSLIFNFVISDPLILKLNQDCRELSDLLDTYFFASDIDWSNSVLQKIERIIKRDREDFAEKISITTDTLEKVTDALKVIPSLINEADEKLQDTVNLISNMTKEQFDYIIQEVRTNLSAVLAESTESFKDSSETIHNAVSSIAEVPDVIVDVKNKFEQVIIDTEKSYNDLNERWAKSIANAVENITTTSLDYVARFITSFENDISEKNATIFYNLGEKVSNYLTTFRSDFETNLVTLLKQSDDVVKKAVSDVCTDINSSMITFSDAYKKHLEAEQYAFNVVANEFKAIMKDVNNQTDLIPAKMQELYTELEKIPKKVKDVNESFDASGLNVVIDQIGEISSSTKKSVLTLITLMNQSCDSFSEVMGKIDNVSQEFDNISEKLERAETKLESGMTAMRISIDKLLEPTTKIWGELDKKFDEFQKKVKSWLGISNNEK